MRLSRRHLFSVLASVPLLAKPFRVAAATSAPSVWPAQRSWTPEPVQAPATEGYVDIGGARLYYWDTGGAGQPLVLLHAGTGHAGCWGYQQPVLAKAGYRVIGYSRRGAYRSEAGAEAGNAVDDLQALLDHLSIRKAHLVGTAAGGFPVMDYVLTYPDRVYSFALVASLSGIRAPDFEAVGKVIMPPAFNALPVEMREIGPSYRAANPDGVARWLELEQMGREEGGRKEPPAVPSVHTPATWEALEKVRVPCLLMTGDADLYLPPARLLQIAAHLPHAQVALIAEAGHAAYWEQPDAFNAALIAFLQGLRPA